MIQPGHPSTKVVKIEEKRQKKERARKEGFRLWWAKINRS
jgi:ribosomal protein L21